MAVVVRSGDNNVFNDGRLVLKSFLDLVPNFLCCQLFCWLLFLALDADGTFEILFSVADKVDTELLLARPPQLLDAGIVQQNPEKNDGFTLKVCVVLRNPNMGWRESSHSLLATSGRDSTFD
jgi:hypothetical protein